jgi:hypothetical protein
MREGELVAEVDGAAATELELLRHAMPDTQEMLASGVPVPAGVAADEGQEEA